MQQNVSNVPEDSLVPPTLPPNQPTNQLCSPQASGMTPAPISNAGDQQLQTQTSTDDEPLPAGWEIR